MNWVFITRLLCNVAVALTRVRAEGGADAFRSRPPNTSRPPSLHVDDFTALHHPYTATQINRCFMQFIGCFVLIPKKYRLHKLSTIILKYIFLKFNILCIDRGMRRGIAVADRGRFASAAPMHAHYRHL